MPKRIAALVLHEIRSCRSKLALVSCGRCQKHDGRPVDRIFCKFGRMDDLKSQEFHMFDFFERTPVFVCIAGKDGYFRKVNPAFVNTLGYSESELFANPIAHL